MITEPSHAASSAVQRLAQRLETLVSGHAEAHHEGPVSQPATQARITDQAIQRDPVSAYPRLQPVQSFSSLGLSNVPSTLLTLVSRIDGWRNEWNHVVELLHTLVDLSNELADPRTAPAERAEALAESVLLTKNVSQLLQRLGGRELLAALKQAEYPPLNSQELHSSLDPHATQNAPASEAKGQGNSSTLNAKSATSQQAGTTRSPSLLKSNGPVGAPPTSDGQLVTETQPVSGPEVASEATLTHDPQGVFVVSKGPAQSEAAPTPAGPEGQLPTGSLLPSGTTELHVVSDPSHDGPPHGPFGRPVRDGTSRDPAGANDKTSMHHDQESALAAHRAAASTKVAARNAYLKRQAALRVAQAAASNDRKASAATSKSAVDQLSLRAQSPHMEASTEKATLQTTSALVNAPADGAEAEDDVQAQSRESQVQLPGQTTGDGAAQNMVQPASAFDDFVMASATFAAALTVSEDDSNHILPDADLHTAVNYGDTEAVTESYRSKDTSEESILGAEPLQSPAQQPVYSDPLSASSHKGLDPGQGAPQPRENQHTTTASRDLDSRAEALHGEWAKTPAHLPNGETTPSVMTPPNGKTSGEIMQVTEEPSHFSSHSSAESQGFMHSPDAPQTGRVSFSNALNSPSTEATEPSDAPAGGQVTAGTAHPSTITPSEPLRTSPSSALPILAAEQYRGSITLLLRQVSVLLALAGSSNPGTVTGTATEQLSSKPVNSELDEIEDAQEVAAANTLLITSLMTEDADRALRVGANIDPNVALGLLRDVKVPSALERRRQRHKKRAQRRQRWSTEPCLHEDEYASGGLDNASGHAM